MRTSSTFAFSFLLAFTSLQAQVTPSPAPQLYPLVNPDHSVTFRFLAPDVPKVSLSLENHPAMPMQKDDAGLWSLTTSPILPEWYSYHFVVNGQSLLDPRNPHLVEGELAAGNTVLVPDATPQPWEPTSVPHGVVHHHTFTTNVAVGLPGNRSDFYVYTPPSYDPRSNTKYPVLYLLHGWSDTAGGWTNIGHANDILDNLIASGKAKPMIVVMPLGYGDWSFLRDGFTVWNDPAKITNNVRLFSQELLTEILPQAEKLYNISAKREDRAITGLSMGGLEGLTIGLAHTDLFAWVGGFSAAVHQEQPATYATLDPKKANLKYLYISVGMNDNLLEPDRKFAATLRDRGFNVTTVETPGNGHVWQQWRADLITFTSTIFQGK